LNSVKGGPSIKRKGEKGGTKQTGERLLGGGREVKKSGSRGVKDGEEKRG